MLQSLSPRLVFLGLVLLAVVSMLFARSTWRHSSTWQPAHCA